MDKYTDRYAAGKILATALNEYANRNDVIVLALPRGGVPVAFEIANALSAPLDVFIVRKLGVPGHEELAMGAIASGGIIVFNDEILQEIPISKSAIDRVINAERAELNRRETVYRGNRPEPNVTDKTVIIVDDGIATGATMRAGITALRKQQPAAIIMAIPVAAKSSCEELKPLVDRIVCPLQPIQFFAVGAWYETFNQTSDDEVFELLAKFRSKKSK